MPAPDALQPDPGLIGAVPAPPFCRLPDPARLFAARAARFDQLAAGHALGPYLAFLAALSAAQDRVARSGLPEGPLPSAAERNRSAEHGMPLVDRERLPASPAFAAALDGLLDALAGTPMPPQAEAAIAVIRHGDDAARARMAEAVLSDAIPFEAVAEHVVVAAALQVVAAGLAARLDPAPKASLGECLCPACGAAPVSSAIVGWNGAHGARYCACSLCGTRWNYVRVKCTACGGTEGISHPQIDGGTGTVKAECCSVCRTELKILYETQDPALDPVADDVASLALDLLVAEDGYRRSGVNPFLIGY